MLRVEASRHFLERLASAGRETLLFETGHDFLQLFASRVVRDGRPKARKGRRVHHVEAGGAQTLVVTDVKVNGRGHFLRLALALDRHVASQVRLVWRLVLGESNVSINAKDARLAKLAVSVRAIDGGARLRQEQEHG